MYESWKQSQLDTYYLLALCHRNIVHLYSPDMVEEGAKNVVLSLTKLAEVNRHEITTICSMKKDSKSNYELNSDQFFNHLHMITILQITRVHAIGREIL